MATTTRSIGPVTLTGADRNGNTANAYIYLQEEYDTDNKQSRVKITRINLEPYHYINDYSCSKTDLYKTSTATGSWVKVNGETLFNCTAANQYGVNLDGTAYSTYGSAVKSWSNSESDTNTGMFSSSYTSWISYTGSKSITVQGYFTWATSGSYPLDTTGGINTSASVSLYTMPTGWSLDTSASTSSVSSQTATSNPTLGMSITIPAYTTIRRPLSFTSSGTYRIHSSSTNNLDVKAWFSTSTSFNSSTGEPSSYLYVDDDSGGNSQFSMNVSVTSGTTYYLYIRCYSTTASGDVTVSVTPNYTSTSLTGYTNATGTKTTSTTLTAGNVKVIPYSFAYSGTATFSSTSSLDTYGLLSTSNTFNASSGKPSTITTYNDDGGSGNNFSISYNVTAGTTYYLYVRGYNMSAAGDVTINVVCPTAPSYTVSVSAGDYVSSVSGGGTYTQGTSVTVNATLNQTTAQYSYSFDGWYNSSGTKVSSSATYTFTVSGAVSLTAKGKRTARTYDLIVDLDANSSSTVSVNGTAYTDDATGVTAHASKVPYGATIVPTIYFSEGYWPKSYTISGVSGTSATGTVTITVRSMESPWFKDGSNIIYIPYVYAASASTRAGEPSGGSEDDSSESWKPYVGYIGSTNTSTGEFYIGQVKT